MKMWDVWRARCAGRWILLNLNTLRLSQTFLSGSPQNGQGECRTVPAGHVPLSSSLNNGRWADGIVSVPRRPTQMLCSDSVINKRISIMGPGQIKYSG